MSEKLRQIGYNWTFDVSAISTLLHETISLSLIYKNFYPADKVFSKINQSDSEDIPFLFMGGILCHFQQLHVSCPNFVDEKWFGAKKK